MTTFPRHPTIPRRRSRLPAGLLLVAALSACSMLPQTPDPALRKAFVLAATADNQLLRFNAGQPGRILARRPISGLQPGETLLGIDYRVAKGQLYGLGSSGRLYRLDAETGAATALGEPIPVALSGDEIGFDFNPTVDRIRVVSNRGQNLRLHPDTGAVVDANPAAEGLQTDGPLAYVAGDRFAGQATFIAAAAYTYNQRDEKITTNYAIDANFGTLVMQGSKEGMQPVVSPNTGQLRTVGPLGVAGFKRAHFDIADTDNAAYAALSGGDGRRARFVEIDLDTGAATPLGTVGQGEAIRGIAIEP